MKYLLLVLVTLGISVTGFSQKTYAPNTTNSLTGAATYCQNATPGVLTYTYNTCSSGSGIATGTSITITWYSNTVNSTSGGTVQSTTFVSASTSATGNTTFLPSTTDVGTVYYYCIITWDGTGLCNPSGSLTSPVAAVVTNAAPDAISGTLSACVGTLTTLSNTVGGGTWTSSATTKATVGSSTGVVGAVASGTATISYSIGTCRTTAVFTVNANPAAITGTQTVCQGFVTTFTDATAGGTWSISNPSIATVGAGSPVGLTGNNAGTAIVSYTLSSSGCYATRALTVNTQPSAITGTLSACIGTQTTLSDGVPGGTWTSATTTRATIDASGVVSAVAAGTSVISYTLGSCRATGTFTVNANPAAITGTQTVCEGAITTFSNTTAGGSWSSASNSIATVTSASPGRVTGVLAGNTTISYTLGTGCYAVRTVTVNTSPTAITGTLSACAGFQSTLSNGIAGGTWTSATTTKATIDASTGLVSAIASGTSVISYTLGSCRSTATFTVNANPAAITGTQTVCQGAVTTFTDATAGGTWSINDPSIATVGAGSPVGLTGNNVGSAIVSYTLGTGCYATRALTVNTTPGPITGTLSACVGALTTLSNSVDGGTWTSATTTKATISATGVVTPVAAGTSVISYTLGSCRSMATFTVNTTPAAITGTQTVCQGAITTFSNAVAGGTWSIDDPSIATLNSSAAVGITGVSVGSSIVSYTIGSCYASRSVTVNTAPGPITGTLSACVGNLTTLSNSVDGGTWTSATTTKATISAAGVVTPVSAGTSVISYTIGSCRSTATFTVNTTPVAITGTQAVCEGAITTFTDATAGGTWSILDPSVATINASSPVGITGILAGSTTVSYTIGSCYATRAVTVNTSPSAISGANSVCIGFSTTLTDGVAGGTWTSSATTRASINASTGQMFGIASGAATISYTIGSCRVTLPVTVNSNPGSISGATSVCENTTTNLSDGTAGGTWSTNDPSIASTDGSNVIHGVNSGVATVSYTLTTGCYAIRALTVNNTPDAISGPASVCQTSTGSYTDATPSGTWSVSNTGRATINTSGLLTGLSQGAVSVSYTTGSCFVTYPMQVLAQPSAISGATHVCEGSATTFTDVIINGTWTSDNTSIATVDDASGVVTGVNSGSTVITYSTGCGTAAVKAITVDITPTNFTGASTVCEGAVSTMSNADAGGSWASTATSVATIDAVSGALYGVTPGTSAITYTLGSCFSATTITVNSNPAAITGGSEICEGASTTMDNATPGGTWSSGAGSIATVDASSPVNITGVSAGTTAISYTLGTGCYATRSILVDPNPSAITGTDQVCEGAVTTFSSVTAGGTWSTSAPGTATIDASSPVGITGLVAGSATISYTLGTGCYTSRGVTVNVSPSAITGNALVCEESPVTFSDGINGGTWSSSDNDVATVDASGVVTGLSHGSVNIIYSIGSCSATYATTVNSLPATPDAITGSPLTFCTGTVVTLADATVGGTWSSASPAVATIDASGVVTGLSAGTATISYAFTNECGTVAATQDVTDLTTPAASITSAPDACYNYASAVTFTGTPGDDIIYKIDGGSDQTATLTGGTFSLGTGVITSSHTYELVSVSNAACSTPVGTTATINIIPMQWVGGAISHENEWQRGSNWSCGFVPDDSATVTIPSGATYYPDVPASASYSIKNLTIASGASITLEPGSLLNVKSGYTNGGAIKGEGIFVMSGTSAQSVSGFGRVDHFAVNNSAGVTINTGSRLTIVKSLIMAAGTLTTHDSLVLYSDSSYNARVEPMTLGTAVNGNVQVQQYIPGGYRRYRFWSHPFSTTISLSQVEKYIDITGQGGAANGFTTTASNNPSCYRYNTIRSNSSLGFDPGWLPFTKINALAADTNQFHQYQGIRLFIRGTKGQGLGYINEVPNPVTITMVGPINQGDQTVTLSKGATTLQDYNMVGNPYPAPVDLGTVCYNARQSGQITGTAFYVWDPYLGAGGQYITVPIGTGAATPYYMQANSCFQVRAANNGSTMSFTELNKGAHGDTLLLREAPEYVSLRIFDANYHPWDLVRVKFNNAATASEDNDYDARKLAGPDFNMYTLSADNTQLAIDARPYNAEEVIPVGISSAYKQAFVIRAEDVVVPGNNPVYLHDKLLNKYVELSKGTEYKFTITDDANTQGNSRFELSMKPAETKVMNTVSIGMVPNPATDVVTISFRSGIDENVSVRILDISGVNVYSSDLGLTSNISVSVPLSNLPAGAYMVEVTHGTQKVTKRLIKE